MGALLLPVGNKPPQQESGHWYTRDGLPAYQQRTQKGGLRATDLRDARKQGLVPSVTTVLGVIAKQALEKWKREQCVYAALTLTRLDDETDAQFFARIEADAGAQAKAAAEEGTRIHDACESLFRGLPVPEQYRPHAEAVRAKVFELFPGVTDWVAEASFAHESGYGGKVDLHSPSTGLVVDYKGKDGDFSDGKKLAYDQHWQLGGYSQGLILPRAPGANIFFSRTHPGLVASHVWKESEIAAGIRTFNSALQLWKELKDFDPAWKAQQAVA